MEDIRLFIQEKLIAIGVYKIDKRHLYECSLEEVMKTYDFYFEHVNTESQEMM